jgi:hypothetical protein
MADYTEEMIMIRAMPCPSCGALPRQHCERPPNPHTGRIKNHAERQMLFHKFIKNIQAGNKPTKNNWDNWHPIDIGDIW